MASWAPTRRVSSWHEAGIPVMGSRRVLRCWIDQAGEMRRSDEALAEEICSGTSAADVRDMLAVRSGGG